MNSNERLAIWQGILERSQASLNDVRVRFSGLAENEIARIRAGWVEQVKTAQEFIGYYEEKISQGH
jgi:hypothetical protein